MRLTDSLEEQATLEAVLEASKPALPESVRGLHYLLATPFRYRPRAGSRFRNAFAAGVWYGAEALRTALAEKSYWRLRFLLDSPGTPELKPVGHTAFRVRVRTRAALDLTRAPFAAERSAWTSPVSYARTQALAVAARTAGIELIRYESVRDPGHAACAAVLSAKVFGRSQPREQQEWFIAAGRERVRCAPAARAAGDSVEFSRAELAVA
ncbi:MAG: RES family NAD+ phosphorylase [Proteobacteria bacterium]|nr:RES family NAD+ phosphorylase [Pseudomonadota bacterium]